MAIQTAQVLAIKYLNVKALCRGEKKRSSQEIIENHAVFSRKFCIA